MLKILFQDKNILNMLLTCSMFFICCSNNGAQDSFEQYLRKSIIASFNKNCTKAIYWMDKARYLAEVELDNKSKEYTTFLKASIPVYVDCGVYDLAEQLSLEFIKKIHPNDPSYRDGLKVIAALYLEVNKFEKAKKISVQALKTSSDQSDTTSLDYIMHIKELGEIYHASGDLAEAERLFLRALQLTNLVGKQFPHDKLPVIFYNLGSVYYDLGQFDKSEVYIEKTKELIDPNTDPENYATQLNILALLKVKKNKFEVARQYYEEALRLNEKTYGNTSMAFTRSLNNLASCEQELQNYSRAEQLFLRSNRVIKEKLGPSHQEYAISINNLAGIYVDLKKIDTAISLYKESLAITKRLYGINHPSYGTTALNLGGLYWEENNFHVAHYYFQKAIQNLLYQIKNIYPIMSEVEKLQFLNNKVRYYLQDFYSFTNEAIKEIPELSKEALNLLLATKTLALDITVDVRKKTIQSKQLDLLRPYEEWKRTRKLIYRFWMGNEIANSNNPIDIFDLEHKADSLEKVISRQVEIYTNQFEAIIKWENIRTQLDTNEVAIAFLDFSDQTSNQRQEDKYVAIIVDKYMEYPQWIELCNKNQLSLFFDYENKAKLTYANDIDLSSDLYQLIWEPFNFFLKHKTKIHYSISGLLNKVAFSQLTSQDGKHLCEDYQLYQYGTLKDFAKIEKEKYPSREKSIVCFGGANFDLFQGKNDQNTSPQINTQALTWSFLPSTEKEVNQIINLLDSKEWNKQQFIGIEATEENLKNCSSDSPRILHIATHGFFFPMLQTDDKNQRQSQSVNFHIPKAISNLQQPMMRSGLVFTGANYAWLGGKVPEDVKDGILTAYEIVNLNLHNTELIVLSTCVSGLGQIENTEGTLGMQRAFKHAGVEKLIISLWEIPDYESIIFMETFYKHYLESDNVNDAFRKTQLEMSTKYDPYYWAGFILLE